MRNAVQPEHEFRQSDKYVDQKKSVTLLKTYLRRREGGLVNRGVQHSVIKTRCDVVIVSSVVCYDVITLAYDVIKGGMVVVEDRGG